MDDDGLADVDFRRIRYDHEAELAWAEAVGLPCLPLYRRVLDSTGRAVHDQDFLAPIEAREGYRREGYRAVAERFLASRA